MAFGLPYDSDAGRDFAATLTAIMCGQAYLQSSKVAEKCPPLASATPLTAAAGHEGGACPGFYVNREPFLDVIRMHRAEVNKIGKSRNSAEPFSVPQLDSLIEASKDCWDKALAHGEKHGYRNSQVTVLAPTGTIGFMMDCDTTGIEPDLALVKYKKLVGGGMIKIVNQTVPTALFKLGYKESEVDAIVSYIDATGTIEGAPAIKPEHLACFDCSFKPSKGTRSIHYTGHVKMMAATQPFLSGAISKTVNLPHDCSLDDIAEAYLEAWRLGLKAVAVYRDGSKGGQPLNTSDGKGATAIKNAKDTSDDLLNRAADRVLAAMASGSPGTEADLEGARSQGLRQAGSDFALRTLRGQCVLGSDQECGEAWTACRARRIHAGPEWAATRGSSSPAGGARLVDAQVLDRGPRGIHHRRPVSQRAAGRDLHQDGQGRLHRLRTDGQLRHRHFARAATRRAAQGALREVRASAL